MSEELKRLMQKIHVAKGASMFQAKDAAFGAIDEMLRLLMVYEARIAKLEAGRK